ncbi:NADP-dependent oxidoreductase domain-containing protein [Lanmaoa asiatica]|nr:NADP-dependent oxidoreductase domain-containing protein [Lanmaoa asiatica]
MAYPTRKIGKDNTPVSAIGFGAMGISAFYGDVEPDEERLKILDAAFQSGCTFWDTANVYGDSEELIGKWWVHTGKRDQIFLATKFGAVLDRPTKHGVDGSAKYVEESFDRSLQRLGVTYVDLYYLHRRVSFLFVMVFLALCPYRQGKVKYLGLSECSADTLRRASTIHPIAAVQLEYSPFELDLERNDVMKTSRELGIKIIAYSPLGRGLLTGRYKSPDDFEEGDFRRAIPRFSKENFPKILNVVEELQAVGKEYNATAGQIALAWLLAQGEDVIPIPGTKKSRCMQNLNFRHASNWNTHEQYLEENLAAARIKLSPEAVQKVRAIAEEAVWDGGRYPAQAVSLLFGDTPPYNTTESVGERSGSV